MNNNQKNNNNKAIKGRDVAAHNDQLGENASEEYRSESYANALTNKNNNKGMK
jgi:hypothetical protein